MASDGYWNAINEIFDLGDELTDRAAGRQVSKTRGQYVQVDGLGQITAVTVRMTPEEYGRHGFAPDWRSLPAAPAPGEIPEDLLRAVVERIKRLSKLAVPNYELPADSLIEEAARDIIKLVASSGRQE